MISVEQATRIVRDKVPDRLIRCYFMYKDEYRFLTSFKPFSVEDPCGIAVVNKNTGDLHFESAGQMAFKFYKLGKEGIELAKEYKQAERDLHNVDLTDAEWKEYQNWMNSFKR